MKEIAGIFVAIYLTCGNSTIAYGISVLFLGAMFADTILAEYIWWYACIIGIIAMPSLLILRGVNE